MEDAEGSDPATENDNNGTSDKSPAPPQNMPPQQQASLVEKALDTACEQLIDEISLKVMLESEDGAEEEWTAYNNFVNHTNKLQPSSIFSIQCSANEDILVQDSLGGLYITLFPPC